MKKFLYLFYLIFILLFLGTAPYQYQSGDLTLNQSFTKLHIFPKKLLREYDPITIFFPEEKVNKKGPEDHPEKYLSLSIDQPGEFFWVNKKTLQFKPADPWPELKQITLTIGKTQHTFVTLMNEPSNLFPQNGDENLEDITEINFVLKRDFDVNTLKNICHIEQRPLPGLDSSKSIWLGNNDYMIKKRIIKEGRDISYLYSLVFDKSIGEGFKVLFHLDLSLDPDLKEYQLTYSFSTREPFRLKGMGCDTYSLLPVPYGGVHYSAQQIYNGKQNYQVVFQFSSDLNFFKFSDFKKLIQINPTVKNIAFEISDRNLYIGGNFKIGQVYQATVSPTKIFDRQNRPLQMSSSSSFYFYFTKKNAFIKWAKTDGIVELYGPKDFPIIGRGIEKIDLRIYKINALDRKFWPYPRAPIRINEKQKPYRPGEEPENDLYGENYEHVKKNLKMLTTPIVSEIITLPLNKNDKSTKNIGLDLSKFLKVPGTYLIGYRTLQNSYYRKYVRLQVTDLCLTSVDQKNGIMFFVTSYKTSLPVSGATLIVEGFDSNINKNFISLFKGTTDDKGALFSSITLDQNCIIKRVIVKKNNDIVVYNPQDQFQYFHNNYWSTKYYSWLKTLFKTKSTKKGPKLKGFLASDRTIYKPEEKVYIKGYVRQVYKGHISFPSNNSYELKIFGPGNKKWEIPIQLNQFGSFHYDWTDDNLPTGNYSTILYSVNKWNDERIRLANIYFIKTTYRIPKFEVFLHSKERVSLDNDFSVSLTARYYAGGKVMKQPVRWRVSQRPFYFKPKIKKGYIFSSDRQYSSSLHFFDPGVIVENKILDRTGSSTIQIHPDPHIGIQPRKYVFEATVTGKDNQTVTETKSVIAMPPFLLGLNIDRFIKNKKEISPKIIAIDVNEKNISGVPIVLKLYKKEWHYHLQETSLDNGNAKYHSEVVKIKILEKKIISSTNATQLTLPVKESGIYVLELNAYDKMDRLQTISVDIYVSGEDAMAWERPKGNVFKTVLDKGRQSYVPGEKATIILESPFQDAKVLAIVEYPDKIDYNWLDVNKGQGKFSINIQENFIPRLPVTFILMRPRIYKNGKIIYGKNDLGKPKTLASTIFIPISPIKNKIKIKLEHPKTSAPGETVSIKISLKNLEENPVSGEVTLWLVDKAVLSLGEKQKLNPLPFFLPTVYSSIEIRDFRNVAFGKIKERITSGGGEGAMAPKSLRQSKELLDKATIRKRFETVPYFNPSIIVNESGIATITVKLPDNLTEFKIQAIACNENQFGYNASKINIRLPLIIQPNLPRFVRYGDKIKAGGIGRVVEGSGGNGVLSIQVVSAKINVPTFKKINLIPKKAEKFTFPIIIDSPKYNQNGITTNSQLKVKMAILRDFDKATDAFEVTIPIKEDRKKIYKEQFYNLKTNNTITLPVPQYSARPGTINRKVIFTYQGALLKMIAGLNYLIQFPHGCLEQQISKAYVAIIMSHIYKIYHIENLAPDIDKILQSTMETIEKNKSSIGLYSYWPGTRPYVSLSAYVLDFLIELKNYGYPVKKSLIEHLVQTLKNALRSDYSYFIDSYSYYERIEALYALTRAGYFDSSYVRELYNKSQFAGLSTQSKLLLALKENNFYNKTMLKSLEKMLWNDIVFKLQNGKTVYGGMQDNYNPWAGFRNYYEIQALATAIQSLGYNAKYDGKLQIIVDELVRMGKNTGWGNTSVNATAVKALRNFVIHPSKKNPLSVITIRYGTQEDKLSIGKNILNQIWYNQTDAKGTISLISKPKKDVYAGLYLSYLPSNPGDEVEAEANGFVVNREMIRLSRKKNIPNQYFQITQAGQKLNLKIGDIVEEHIRIINPSDRYFVAIVSPLAAGLEYLNPHLLTSPPESKPDGINTKEPDYSMYEDDRIAFYFNFLPAGTYDFYYRIQALNEGSFVQPPAYAEMMYNQSVNGNSPGLRIEVVDK